MPTNLTSKGQVTIPKHIRDALNLKAGAPIEFAVNAVGEIVLRRVDTLPGRPDPDRFEKARGTAQVKWSTDELMKMLRPDD